MRILAMAPEYIDIGLRAVSGIVPKCSGLVDRAHAAPTLASNSRTLHIHGSCTWVVSARRFHFRN